MHIYPYKANSGSVKRLKEALGAVQLKREGRDIAVDTLINWGCHRINRTIMFKNLLNYPANVSVAGNKLKTFKALDGHVGIPEWTESAVEALKWLAEGVTVIARHNLTGNSGDGIEVMETYAEWRDHKHAPLYTKYARQEQEYRVHVFQGKPIFLQRKARKKAVPDDQVNWKIRNHANGFIFAHKDVVVPQEVQDEAVKAVDILGLDFGAVDVALGKDLQVYVFEVNTAPGIEATCLEAYVKAFKELM